MQGCSAGETPGTRKYAGVSTSFFKTKIRRRKQKIKRNTRKKKEKDPSQMNQLWRGSLIFVVVMLGLTSFSDISAMSRLWSNLWNRSDETWNLTPSTSSASQQLNHYTTAAPQHWFKNTKIKCTLIHFLLDFICMRPVQVRDARIERE